MNQELSGEAPIDEELTGAPMQAAVATAKKTRSRSTPSGSFRFLCVGAANVDEKWSLTVPWQPATSLPATRSLSFGGVARNVAENLARLGQGVTLVAPLGSDADSRSLARHARACGIRLLGAQSNQVDGLAGCRYVAVLDAQGELVVGLNDMRALSELTPAFWRSVMAQARRADLVLFDLNLPRAGLASALESLRALPARTRPSVLMVAVSSPKMTHLPDDLHGVDALLLNADEWQALARMRGLPARLPPAGTPLRSTALGAQLCQQGLQAVVITQGARGVKMALCADEQPVLHVPALPAKVVDVTGAGDAFTAGFCAGWAQALQRLPTITPRTLQQATRLGLRLARDTLQSPLSVSPTISPALLSGRSRS